MVVDYGRNLAVTSKESFMQPSQRFFADTLGGTISATGCPNRVTSTHAPVRRTLSSTARHVALVPSGLRRLASAKQMKLLLDMHI